MDKDTPTSNNGGLTLSPKQLSEKAEEERLNHSSTLTGSGYYNSINPSGPQLCYSPYYVNSGYSSLAEANPEIHVPDDELQSSAENSQSVEETKVFKRRWYILLVYSLLAATQGGIWNVYGPISATVEDTFGWTDATIALLSNWGPVAFLLGAIVLSWMMDVKGLRLACLVSSVLVAGGAALKCISFTPPLVTWLAHVGQFLNGLAGPVAMAAPPILSAMWFPPQERTTATAIGTVFNYMGVSLSFIMGPYLVPDVPITNLTENSAAFQLAPIVISNETAIERVDRQRKGVALYTYIGGGWSALMLLLFVIYFPSKPPLPPSPSAAIQRENFLKGLKSLMKRGQFWLVALVYGVSTGTLGCWSSVLDVILKPYGIEQTTAGWIGFYATCSSCVVSLIVARFADFFSRIMKKLIMFSFFVGTVSFLVFALTTIQIIPPSRALFYLTIIVGYTAINAVVPLIFELACELSYPTGEGITNGVLTIVNNIAGLVFLSIMLIPNIGSEWTIWMLVGTSGVCLPLIFLMKEQYNRLEIDEHNPSLRAEIIVKPPSLPAISAEDFNTPKP